MREREVKRRGECVCVQICVWKRWARVRERRERVCVCVCVEEMGKRE
jgi:hypothetical protein